MIALIISGLVICFILFLLLLPLAVDLTYENELILKVKYSGITIFDTEKSDESKKSKKVKEKPEDDPPIKKDGIIKKTYKEKGLFGTISYFSQVLSIILKRLCWIVKRFKFRRFMLDLTVATDDSANTAIQYGSVCAVLYPVLSLLQSTVDLKSKEVNINADFEKSKWEFKTSILVKAQLIYWIIAAIGTLKQYYKLQRKEREKYERKQFEDRNGHHDGKASHNG